MRRQPNALRIAIALLVTATLVFGAIAILRSLGGGGRPLSASPMLLPVTDDNQTSVMGDGLVSFDGQKLFALTAQGRTKWSQPLSNPNASLSASDSLAVVYTQTQIYIFDDTGKLTFSDKVNETIRQVRCGKTHVAVLTEGETPSVRVIDKEGRFIDAKPFQGVSVLDFGFYTDTDQLYSMTLDAYAATPYTAVTTYEPGKLTTGQITFADELIYRAVFHKNSAAFVGTQNVTWAAQAAAITETGKTLVYGRQSMAQGVYNDRIYLALAPVDEAERESGVQTLYLQTADSQREVHLPVRAPFVCIFQDAVFAVGPSAVMRVPLAEGAVTQRDLPLHVERVLGVTRLGSLVVSSGGSLYSLALQ